ncbi:MAG: hypothetical protein ACKO1K_11980 [Burkholderiales bacterium]
MILNHDLGHLPNDQAQQLAADQALEAMLRADAAEWRAAYIHNDGFSDAVMHRVAQLPATTTARTFGRYVTPRLVIVSAAAVIGAVLAIFSSGGNLLIDAVMDLATFTVTPSVVAIGGMLLVASTATIITATTER